VGGILGQSGKQARQAEAAQQAQIARQQDTVDRARALTLQDDLGEQTNQLARLYGSNGLRNTLSTAPLVGGMVR
jgi:hypothetical protein